MTDPARPEAHHAAWADVRAGRLQEAEDTARRILDDAPRDAQALHLLGVVTALRGRGEEAVATIGEAVRIAPGQPTFHCNLGNALTALGRLDDAVAAYDAAIRLATGYVEAHVNRANALQTHGRLRDAAEGYSHALTLSPDDPGALCNLGVTLSAMGDAPRAGEMFQRLLKTQPNHAEALIGLGEIWRTQGKATDAISCFRRVLERRPDMARAWRCLAKALHGQGQVEEAIGCYRRVIALGGEGVEAAYADLVRGLYMQGSIDEARAELDRFCTRFPHSTMTAPLKAVDQALALEPDEVERFEDALEGEAIGDPGEAAGLHFALGAHFDRAGEHDRAFRHFARGNGIRSREYTYDPDLFDAAVDETCALIGRDLIEALAAMGSASERPVFIVGMMRSGTTLTEQILASHPDVAAGGELTVVGDMAGAVPMLLGESGPYRRCLARLTAHAAETLTGRYLAVLDRISPTAARVSNKNPGNYFNLGLLSILFPNARIIHCRRDPRDTCLSIYFQTFAQQHRYAYELYLIGRRYRAYRRMMAHWRQALPTPFLDLDYEAMVGNQEATSRRLMDFCGLSWDERVLQFHRTRRTVDTASLWQVRQPIYGSSVGRWKPYREHLAPLERGLRGEPR